MQPVSTSKPLRSTWCGFAGTQYTLNFEKSSNGRRVAIIVYDNGNVTLRAVRGDGRNPRRFREYDAIARTGISFEQACELARDMADRHFQAVQS